MRTFRHGKRFTIFEQRIPAAQLVKTQYVPLTTTKVSQTSRELPPRLISDQHSHLTKLSRQKKRKNLGSFNNRNHPQQHQIQPLPDPHQYVHLGSNEVR